MLFNKILWSSQKISPTLSSFWYLIWFILLQNIPGRSVSSTTVLCTASQQATASWQAYRFQQGTASRYVPLRFMPYNWYNASLQNVPSVAAQPTVTHSYTSSLPTGKTQLCNKQASSSSSSSNSQQHNRPFVLSIPSTPFSFGVLTLFREERHNELMLNAT